MMRYYSEMNMQINDQEVDLNNYSYNVCFTG